MIGTAVLMTLSRFFYHVNFLLACLHTPYNLVKRISSKCGTRRNTWKSVSWDKLERSCSTRSGQKTVGREAGGGGLRERGRQVHRTANYISEGKNEQCIKT